MSKNLVAMPNLTITVKESRKMKKVSKKIIEALEANDWSLSEVYEQDGKYYVEIENYSPAGENIIETVWFDGTSKGFVQGLEELAESFDADEHAELWVDKRGKNGVPETIRELIDDADAIQEMLNEAAEKVKAAVLLQN